MTGFIPGRRGGERKEVKYGELETSLRSLETNRAREPRSERTEERRTRIRIRNRGQSSRSWARIGTQRRDIERILAQAVRRNSAEDGGKAGRPSPRWLNRIHEMRDDQGKTRDEPPPGALKRRPNGSRARKRPPPYSEKKDPPSTGSQLSASKKEEKRPTALIDPPGETGEALRLTSLEETIRESSYGAQSGIQGV